MNGQSYNRTLERIDLTTDRLRSQHQQLYQSLPGSLQYSVPNIMLYSNDSGVITTAQYNLLDAVTLFASKLSLATKLTPTEFHRDHPTVWFILENGPFSIYSALQNATIAAQLRSRDTRTDGMLIETMVRPPQPPLPLTNTQHCVTALQWARIAALVVSQQHVRQAITLLLHKLIVLSCFTFVCVRSWA